VKLGDATVAMTELGGAVEQLPRRTCQDGPPPVGNADRAGHFPVAGNHGCRVDLRRDLDEIRESARRIHDSDSNKVQTLLP